MQTTFRFKRLKASNLLAPFFLFFALLIVILCFYPGTTNLDSEWQLKQAVDNIYFDGHPPIMAYLWHTLNILFKSTAGNANMFLFIAFIFISALVLITFIQYLNFTKRYLFFFSVLLLPPILLILGFIIKDSLMTALLLLAYALLLVAQKKSSFCLLFLSLIPLFFSFSTRYNAIFAIIPLVTWFMLTFLTLINKKCSRKSYYFFLLLGTSFILLTFFLLNYFINTKLIKAHKNYASQFLFAYDLVGVSVRSKQIVLPPFYAKEKPLTHEFLNFIYRPYTNYYVFWPGQPGDPTLSVIGNDNDAKELVHYWLQAIFKHPSVFILHKVEIFFSSLGILHSFAQLAANDLSSPLGIPWSSIIPKEILNGWIYLTILTVLLCFVRKMTIQQKVLFWSGLLYGWSWIVCTPNTEQRYYFWVIVTAILLLMDMCMAKFFPKDN